MPIILIDILPALGHFHATLKMANQLKSVGYEVLLGSSLSLKTDIEKFGFQFIHLPEITFTNVSLAEKATRNTQFLTFLYRAFYHERYSEKKKSAELFLKAVEQIKPDLVLLDEQAALKTFLYEKINIGVATFQTKPDTRKISGLPPFTSYYLPNNTFTSKVFANLIWFRKLLIYRLNNLNNRALNVGQDNFSIVKKLAKEFKVYNKNRIDLKRSFCVGVNGIPRFVISPESFDFPHNKMDNVYQIGPLINVKREGKLNQPRYSSLLKRLEEKNNTKNRFVVYCSLGTIKARFKKPVQQFFKKLIRVAVLNKNITFVLSTGDDFQVEELFPVPENMYIFDNVPQIDLLHFCDLMITHGGMNSITECIYNYVPMLVYPLSPHWDQPGNSARVLFHGLGLRGKISRDSTKTISKKINKLKSNHRFYKDNIQAMRVKFEINNNSQEWLKIIEKIILNKSQP